MQVRGQKKEQKKLKANKQEVEIRQGMTAAALAAAMNKDFGEAALVGRRGHGGFGL